MTTKEWFYAQYSDIQSTKSTVDKQISVAFMACATEGEAGGCRNEKYQLIGLFSFSTEYSILLPGILCRLLFSDFLKEKKTFFHLESTPQLTKLFR